jgi:hypothetical protein
VSLGERGEKRLNTTGLRHVLSTSAWTLRSQVRILLGAWMCVSVFLCCVVLCFGRGLVLDWSPNQGESYQMSVDREGQGPIRTVEASWKKKKSKVNQSHPRALSEHHAMREYRRVELHFWTRHYMEVSGQLHAPPALLLRKESLVPLGLEAGWALEPVWTRW